MEDCGGIIARLRIDRRIVIGSDAPIQFLKITFLSVIQSEDITILKMSFAEQDPWLEPKKFD